MKKLILTLVILTIIFSCKGKENEVDYVIFSGNIKNTNETILKMGKYDYTLKKEITIDKSGNFKDTLYISEKGFYNFQVGRSYTSVFLKKGDDLHITFDGGNLYKSIHATGKAAELNNYYFERNRLKSKLVGDAKAFFVVPLDDFLAKLDNNNTAYLKHLEEANLNPLDKEIQRKMIKNDYILTKFNYDKFNHYHTKKHPVLPEGYNDLIFQMNIDDDESFHYDRSYRILIVEYWRQTSRIALEKDPNLTAVAFVENMVKDIKSIKIKEQIVSMLFRQMKIENKNYESDYNRIMALLETDAMKAKLTSRYNSVGATKPEMASFDFNYENHKGGKTSLKDLRGKILYVEIWATWCGPCIKEMPALTQLIKDYKGKNIEFVSISIDSKNDYEKWKNMVPEKNVGGIQLLADNGLKSDFMKAFSVGLIPRSILIDENGKIITPKAPRPSSSDTRPYLDKLLK